MTVTPWSPLANGLLTGKYNGHSDAEGRLTPGRSRNRVTDHGLAIAEVVVSVAGEIGRTPAQVALAWLLHQPGSVIPLIGARSVDQLDDNLGCLDVELTRDPGGRATATGVAAPVSSRQVAVPAGRRWSGALSLIPTG